MNNKELILQELRRRGVVSDSQPQDSYSQNKNIDVNKQKVIEELTRRGVKIPNGEKDFSWPSFFGEQAIQGQLDNPDILAVLPQVGAKIVKNVAQSKDMHIDDFEAIPSDAVMSSEAGKRYYEKLQQELAQTPPKQEEGFYVPSETLKGNIKSLTDVDLSSQGEGDTAGKRIVGRAVRNSSSGATLGAFAGPLGSLTGAGVGALYGAGSQILSELNMNPLIADLVTAFGTTGAMNILKRLNKLRPSVAQKLPAELTEAETKVAKAIKSQMTEDEVSSAIKNIKSHEAHQVSGYEPLTAEVAESPAIAQIHRVRQGVPNSRIAHKEGVEHNKLISAFNEREIAPIESRQLQEELKGELANRENIRREATSEAYEKISKMDKKLNPKNLKNYLRNDISRGSIEKDLNQVRKDIKPRSKLSKAEQLKELANYKKEMASIETYKDTPYYDALKANIKKPGFLEPSVSELWATKKAINSKIKARKKASQDENVQALTEAKKALERDLEAVPLIKETDKLYRELSIPIDEIKKHPKLGKMIKSTANDVISDLFDKNSYDNAVSLKKALGKHETIWSGVEDAIVKKTRDSISNISAKGGSRELSYNKLNKFMEKHGKALEEIFTRDQMELLNETRNILRGQNKVKTLGLESGSPTQSRVRTETDLKNLLGITEEELSGASTKGVLRNVGQSVIGTIPYAGKIANKKIDALIEGWAKGNEEKLMNLVDNFLKDKQFATRILEGKYQSQFDFNKFINNNLKRPALIYGAYGSKSKENN